MWVNENGFTQLVLDQIQAVSHQVNFNLELTMLCHTVFFSVLGGGEERLLHKLILVTMLKPDSLVLFEEGQKQDTMLRLY